MTFDEKMQILFEKIAVGFLSYLLLKELALKNDETDDKDATP